LGFGRVISATKSSIPAIERVCFKNINQKYQLGCEKRRGLNEIVGNQTKLYRETEIFEK